MTLVDRYLAARWAYIVSMGWAGGLSERRYRRVNWRQVAHNFRVGLYTEETVISAERKAFK